LTFTTEFDLAHDVIRLFRQEGCQPPQLVHWGNGYFLNDLYSMSGDDPHMQTNVLVNGQRVRALLDTGASVSYILAQAATRAGIVPGGKDTTPAQTTHGVAGVAVESWVGRFDTVAIGNETIRNAKLRIADLNRNNKVEARGSHIPHIVEGMPDMILGDDFFLSHRVVVMPHEHKVLFTYNGGTIFQALKPNELPVDAAVAKDPPTEVPVQATTP
jgi:hypothetical protein